MTNRILAIITAILAATLSAFSQVTPQSAFTTAPVDVYPFIDRSMRLDMLDYHSSGIDKRMVNSLGDSCSILPSEESLLNVSTAPGLVHTFVPLEGKSGQIIMIITTADTPSPDSSVAFYTHDWKPLPADRFLSLPDMDNWFSKLSRDDRDMIREYVPFLTYTATFSPSSLTLTLVPTQGDYIDPDRTDRVKTLLVPSIEYKWNGKKFTR